MKNFFSAFIFLGRNAAPRMQIAAALTRAHTRAQQPGFLHFGSARAARARRSRAIFHSILRAGIISLFRCGAGRGRRSGGGAAPARKINCLIYI